MRVCPSASGGLLAAAFLAACLSDPVGLVDDAGNPIIDAGPSFDARPGGVIIDDGRDTVSGCAGVYNPDQVLRFTFTLDQGDWSALQADSTFELLFPAQMQCEDEPPINVGIRHKRSGLGPKVGLKVDTNAFVTDQTFHGLHKLSFENGVSTGEQPTRGAIIKEYLAWRIQVLGGGMTGRAALAQVTVNGQDLGVYAHVEQPDKVFLALRLGDDSGWLFKKSGYDDGYRTNELEPNPWEERLCFWSSSACPVPADLATYMPANLDIEQMLRIGGVNTLMGNLDGPLPKDNNYYRYDYATGPRAYFPWDLDSAMTRSAPFFPTGMDANYYHEALFTHWADDYDALMTGLLEGPLSLAKIEAELDRVITVASTALDSDPVLGSGSTAQEIDSLRQWWTSRHAEAAAELSAH